MTRSRDSSGSTDSTRSSVLSSTSSLGKTGGLPLEIFAMAEVLLESHLYETGLKQDQIDAVMTARPVVEVRRAGIREKNRADNCKRLAECTER
jgi:hypothetical protein